MPSLIPAKMTLFAVARKGQPIDDTASADLAGARAQLKFAEDGMRAAGLKPDLELVTIEYSTSFGKPQRYVEAEPAAEPEQSAEPGEPVEQ